MYSFYGLERLIPISTFQKTYSCSYPTIFFNVPETLYSGISHEDFLNHMMGKTPCEIQFTMSLIPISKEDRDMCQQIKGIVEWLTYKPIVSDECSTPLYIVTDFNTSDKEFSDTDNDECSTPLDIVTDFNTSDKEFSDTDNDECFSQSSKQTLNTRVFSENLSADDVVSIGIYTRNERREKIKRYRSKKRKFSSYFVYECRSKFAKIRPRKGGRFVKKY